MISREAWHWPDKHFFLVGEELEEESSHKFHPKTRWNGQKVAKCKQPKILFSFRVQAKHSRASLYVIRVKRLTFGDSNFFKYALPAHVMEIIIRVRGLPVTAHYQKFWHLTGSETFYRVPDAGVDIEKLNNVDTLSKYSFMVEHVNTKHPNKCLKNVSKTLS